MIVETLREFWRAHGLRPETTLVAVSGGIDSTALLVAMTEGGVAPLAVGHVNHHLRGDESDGDEAFVRDLCARLGVPLHVAGGTLDPALVRECGVEAAAREVRMARLHEMREAAGAAYIATAHQKNDQAETVLMRLVAGGGIAALQGIRPFLGDRIVRPLLGVTRAEIERFLADRDVVPRVDSSNADPRFVRNRVRHLLRELGPATIDNLAALADQVRAQWPLVERAVDAADDTEVSGDQTLFRSLPDDPWLRQALLHRHIRRLDPWARDVSARDLQRLAAQLDSLKRVSVTKTLELLRRDGNVILRKRPQPAGEFEAQIQVGEIAHGIGVRRATGNPATQQPSNQRFQLPKGAEPHFTVRNRRRGDRVKPEKKLKELLIDRKIAAESRDRIPLLLWNGQIVWVPGVEVSEAFRVTDPPADLYEAWVEEDQESVQQEGDRPADRRPRR